MLHYGLFYLQGSRHRHPQPYPPRPPRSDGGGPRGRPQFTGRAAATLVAVVLCLGGAGYAAASEDGGGYGGQPEPAGAQPQRGDQDLPSRPGRLGGGPLR